MESIAASDAFRLDFLSRDELHSLQWSRLQAVVQKSYERVPLFRSRMEERGLTPSDLRSLSDLSLLPFMQKTDLRDTYPFGLFAEPMNRVARLHASSGTTGKPIVVGYTLSDLEQWSTLMARGFHAIGMDETDIVQNAFGYGMFTGGLGVHYGVERLGATVVPASTGNTERQIMLLQDFGVTTLFSTPSYFLYLMEKIKEAGLSFSQLALKRGVFGAEPWTVEMRNYIESETGIKAYDIYGLTEIMGPGVAIECPMQNGFHLFEDSFLMEIVDPETGAVLPEGEWGELVITTLTKEAFPVIRYRTHDITRILPEPCSCGRTLRRIDRIQTRCDDMMIIRGVNVFPSQIEAALLSVAKTQPHYRILLTKKNNLDQIEVQVEVAPDLFTDKIGELEGVRQAISHAIEFTVGLRVPVYLVEPGTLTRCEGKSKRVLDLRNQPSS